MSSVPRDINCKPWFQFSLRGVLAFAIGLTLVANVPRFFVALPDPSGYFAWRATMFAAGFGASVLLATAIALQMTNDLKTVCLRLWCMTALAVSPIPGCVVWGTPFWQSSVVP